MTKDVIVTISGLQFAQETETEPVEIVTAMEQSFLLLIISVGSSWISITDSVCIMDILSRLRLFFSARATLLFPQEAQVRWWSAPHLSQRDLKE